MSVTIIPDGPRHRRRVYAMRDSVLVMHEELRAWGGGQAWCIARVEPVHAAYPLEVA